MNYSQTIDYLFSRLPMYQREGSKAYKINLDNIVAGVKYLKNPHKKFKSIHIAGTNGKGSTAHMLSSILQTSKYQVGLYTSPHLKDFRERIKINNKMISKKYVIDFVQRNKRIFEQLQLSFFELTVMLAFEYFSEKKVDIAIIECGLGGRLDSTNIIKPEISIITNISLDHTDLLGDSIEKIAIEKAGIIKPNTPIIIGRSQISIREIFNTTAQRNNSKIIYADNKKANETDLKGRWQKENINTTLTAINELKLNGWKIDNKSIKNGLLNVVKNTSLLGRWQIINTNPTTICDTGHNEDSLKAVCNELKKIKYEKLHFIFGIVKDKKLTSILPLLPKKASYYFCNANIERAMNAKLLQQKSLEYNIIGKSYLSVLDAIKSAQNRANKNDLIFIGGSTFVVAEAI